MRSSVIPLLLLVLALAQQHAVDANDDNNDIPAEISSPLHVVCSSSKGPFCPQVNGQPIPPHLLSLLTSPSPASQASSSGSAPSLSPQALSHVLDSLQQSRARMERREAEEASAVSGIKSDDASVAAVRQHPAGKREQKKAAATPRPRPPSRTPPARKPKATPTASPAEAQRDPARDYYEHGVPSAPDAASSSSSTDRRPMVVEVSRRHGQPGGPLGPLVLRFDLGEADDDSVFEFELAESLQPHEIDVENLATGMLEAIVSATNVKRVAKHATLVDAEAVNSLRHAVTALLQQALNAQGASEGGANGDGGTAEEDGAEEEI